MKSYSPAVDIVPAEGGFTVMEGGEDVLFYRRELKTFDETHSRSHYIHPLYGPDGEILTEESPADHRHQCGIFWAWHQVWVGDRRMGDAWILKAFTWDVQDAKVIAADSQSSALEVQVVWMSPHWTDAGGVQKPFVKEEVVIRVYRASGDVREIDFEICLIPLEDGVRIGGSEDDKGYGGFSPRIRLPEDVRITGCEGAVAPARQPVEAGPWLDFSGSFGEQDRVSGLAILCHPSLPGFPQPWILRRKGSMQNPVYPGPQPVALQTPLTLRYRLVVHRGDAQAVDLDGLYARYSAEGP